MAKINPAIKRDLDNLLVTVNDCGRVAKALILRGMTIHDFKKAAKQKYGWRVGSYAANIIFSAIKTVW